MNRAPEKSRKPVPKSKQPSVARRPRRASSTPSAAQTDPAVIALLRGLEHPLKKDFEALRRIILETSPAIREEVKWNVPSFRTTEHFATFNLRQTDCVRLILHAGAKVKASSKRGIFIPDPAGLLQWLASDRCLVSFDDEADIRKKRPALQAIIRAWIRLL